MKSTSNNASNIISTMGILITTSTFLSFYFSWSYARGYYSLLGLPTHIFSLYKSFELFPEVGFTFVFITLFAILIGGMLGWQIKKIESIKFVVYLIENVTFFIYFAVVCCLLLSYKQNSYSDILFSVGFFLVGFIIATDKLNLLRIIICIMLLYFSVESGGSSLYKIGMKHSKAILENPNAVALDVAWTENMAHAPIVAIVSDKKFIFTMLPEIHDNKYVYLSDGDKTIRLVYIDDNMYYFLEGTHNSVHRIVAVNKSNISEIHYFKYPDKANILNGSF